MPTRPFAFVSRRLLSLALGVTTALALVACGDSDDSSEDDASTTTAPATSTTAAAATTTKSLVVGYTRTYVQDDRPPPERSRAEISFDRVSFRMTRDDGSGDSAYDAATGQAYEWFRGQKAGQEKATLISGLATGGPGGDPLSDGPTAEPGILIGALGRAGDPRVTTITRQGRPAWHYDGPMVGDSHGGATIEGESVYNDRAVFDVDKATGAVLLLSYSGKGQDTGISKETYRFEATSVEERPSEDRARYRPEAPGSARIDRRDYGFRAMTLDEMAATAGYDVLVPSSVPAGYELAEVVFNEKEEFGSGAEGSNPSPTRVTSMLWRHADGRSFAVALLPKNGGPKSKGGDAAWSDPYGSEGSELPPEKVSIPIEGRAPLAGELFVAVPSVPHLWGITGDLVVTVDGNLDAAGLKAVAGSLRKHTPAAPSSAAPAECPQIGFTPDSDDVAGDIAATGLDCTEASDLVRRTREQHYALGSPRLFRLDPFTCRAVFEDGPGLANTTYRCEDGPRRVTWRKT
jgi:hypothetical protein